jgi:tRNA(Ile)-lysidine synthase
MRSSKPELLVKFERNITESALFDTSHRILMAVSGGADSMAMAWLTMAAGFDCGIAHCNFQLRGTESDGDEELVKSFCDKNGLPFFTRKFNTKAYAAEHKFSIQVAARQLRYEWFEEIRLKNGYQYLATAHHKDDQIETFFINLLRGSGLQGLKGIPQKAGHIVRPMLFASRAEIEAFTVEAGIAFRNDSSNASDYYLRNKLRHQLIPVLSQINPSAGDSIVKAMQNVDEALSAVNGVLMTYKSRFFSVSGDTICIDMTGLIKLEEPAFWLYGLIQEFGFSHTDARNIVASVDNSGKTFYAGDQRLVIERGFVQIGPKSETGSAVYSITELPCRMHEPGEMIFEILTQFDVAAIPKTPQHVWLDADLVKLPLTLRRRRAGDTFCPFGMRGRQKLSDFFVHQKITNLQKENTWLLCSGDEIVWVVGHRVDNRFKVSEKTKRVLKIRVSVQ